MNLVHYNTFSVFFVAGRGFQVLRGDATLPTPEERWRCLRFQHKDGHSIVTNAGDQEAMRFHQEGAQWPAMLLPDIYHGRGTRSQSRGGLTGELPIFLALIALSMPASYLPAWLPDMFRTDTSGWRFHGLTKQWVHKRGVVVNVWAVPSEWSMSSPIADIVRYENGTFNGRQFVQF